VLIWTAEVAFLDRQPAPDLLQKLGLRHHPVGMRVQMGQHVEGPRAQVHGCAADEQDTAIRVEPIRAWRVVVRHLCKRPPVFRPEQ
jgi:hypothetical protein